MHLRKSLISSKTIPRAGTNIQYAMIPPWQATYRVPGTGPPGGGNRVVLVAALAEMYVRGVSTRKVAAVTEELCGHGFSASSISGITARL